MDAEWQAYPSSFFFFGDAISREDQSLSVCTETVVTHCVYRNRTFLIRLYHCSHSSMREDAVGTAPTYRQTEVKEHRLQIEVVVDKWPVRKIVRSQVETAEIAPPRPAHHRALDLAREMIRTSTTMTKNFGCFSMVNWKINTTNRVRVKYRRRLLDRHFDASKVWLIFDMKLHDVFYDSCHQESWH